MILFLTTFFVIYGGMHFYLYAGLRSAVPLAAGPTALLAFFFAAMVFAPLGERLLERNGREGPARFVAYTGYLWMGFIFIYCAAALLFDAYDALIAAAGAAFASDSSGLIPPPPVSFLAAAAVSVGINLYGCFEAAHLKIERLTVESSRIPGNVEKIRIVQISDVHVGLIVRGRRLERIIEAVANHEPDILVSTGDLLDGETTDVTKPAALLNAIRPRYGKFAVMGNHEFFAGIAAAAAFHETAGFTVLRGAGTSAAGGLIQIAGVDDPMGRHLDGGRRVRDGELLSGFGRDRFTLFLKHQPIVESGARGLFDLQLSGHTHRGQIFPFSLLTRLFYRYHTGYVPFPDGSHLYVSRGAGTWGPPVRFLAPPEIAVIDLVPEKR
jgi:predicted MPP superfamily phosphohydrolase